MDIAAGCGGPIALLSFLRDLGEGPGAERRQGRWAGGGIAETSFGEVHVCLQTALGCRETARICPGCGRAAGCREAARVSGARAPQHRPAPLGLRPRPVRPRAPCPVVRRAPLPARWALAPSSFGEPTLIEATISTEHLSCLLASPLESDLQRGSVESEHSLFRATDPCIPSSFTAKLI